MNKNFLATLLASCLIAAVTSVANADGQEAEQAELEQSRAEYGAMVEEADQARAAAQEVAEQARAMAAQRAEMEREASERKREASREFSEQRAQQAEEMAVMREELSRAHRELREASREIAKAHRELARAEGERERERVRYINLGDRAVIGVVLGEEKDEGVEVIGVSPDGPAERAGLQQGDILVALRGASLAAADNDSARAEIFEIMDDVAAGEELAARVLRSGETWDFMVTAEQREPRSWQSYIRLPEDVHAAEGVAGAPHAPQVIIERIEIPEIDAEALAAQVDEITRRIEKHRYMFVGPDGEDLEFSEEIHIDSDDMSHFGGHALMEANVWFGLPRAQGLELTTINPGLGEYFKTDHGVLVIEAREDNVFELESGDVILQIDATPVESPTDMMRALREIEAGSEVDIAIKRNRRDKTLTVPMPENRFGFSESFGSDYFEIHEAHE
jgi:C-terminal processing protease CtpA/Prc